ncbi:amino acid adenylation protein [Caballeronia choica]|uniref:Amino acid adenylation protein n=1 Tax=Caballeronia choica TaxID=326476 RepID=A0A158H0Z4_9BURK|nr:condensation domain-containing protein [Caballeronia choica]SAL37539.1 amino acid adenylation protein [Caballeronia choica]
MHSSVNAHRRILPDGIIGELYVGGDGLGLGYFQRPALTEAAFVAHPYEPGERLYRTGDYACVGRDQMLYFHGRRDHQVKIRGHRVELGEIESLLVQYPAVSGAVVLPRTDAVGEPALIAYLLVDRAFDDDALRAWLRAQLPAAFVPVRFECLDVFPVTPNGKVDRAALAAADGPTAHGTDMSLPRDIGEALAILVAETLGLSKVAPGGSFIGLGGSSLAAARLAWRIETVLRRRCSASMILAAPSLATLAETLRHALPPKGGPGANALPLTDRPASPQQRSLYVEQLKSPASTAYNLPMVVEFEKAPDLTRLRDALAQLVARHPMLAASFDVADGMVMQRVGHELPIGIEVSRDPATNLSAHVRPFDPGVAPLWRAVLVDGERPRLLFDIHHILCDGHALRNLFDEWDRIYRGMQLEKPALSYADYVEWLAGSLSGARKEQQRAFWLDALQPLAPAIALPTDRSREGPRADRGGHVLFEIGAERAAALSALVRGLDATLFQGLIAAYVIWLSRSTASRDMVIGVPFLGRQAPGSDHVFGICVNTVCLRFELSADDTFEQVIRHAAARSVAASEHQDYPFDELVRELVPTPDYRRHPIFDTMFAFQETGLTGMSALGGTVHWVPAATEATLFDLNLQIECGPKGLLATWGFARDVFDRSTVEGFAEEYLGVLDTMISTPAGAIAQCLEDRGTLANLPDVAFSF